MVKIIHEREVFTTKMFSVKEIDLEFTNKKKATYSLVEKKDSVLLVPVTYNNQLVMIKEYFAAIDEWKLALPKGDVESSNIKKEANKELQEEAGYKAGQLISLGKVVVSPGNTRHTTHLFLARKLIESKLDGDEEEEIKVVKIPFNDFETLIERGELNEARVIAALYLARKFLEKKQKVTQTHSIPN